MLEFPPLLMRTPGQSKSAAIDMAYQIFWEDFVYCAPDAIVENLPVRLKHGVCHGKELTFWHLGSNSADFLKNGVAWERCQYIPWIKFMLVHYQECFCWQNWRKGEQSLCLVDPEWKFVVVLRYRPKYFLLWTAYPLSAQRRRKLQKEYQEATENAN